MVHENNIDQAIDILDEEKTFILQSEKILKNHSAIIAYLSSEGFGILSEEEKDLLWYCLVVMFKAIELQKAETLEITMEALEEAEEDNYSRIGEKDLKFLQIADILFQDYEEEDLLAFVEDTLVPDDDDFPSPVGRKVIFISLKTIIDVLI